jgi:hypothetical protein
MATYRDDVVMYDELEGPDLDAARWAPARLPLPTGGEHIPLDPHGELIVGKGEVRVAIPRFSLSHDVVQSADSATYLGAHEPFIYMVESPYADFDDAACRPLSPRSTGTARFYRLALHRGRGCSMEP